MKAPFRKQSGSVLLTLMLVVIVAASFTLVSQLNASSRIYIRQQSTMETLRQAKAALIAYAVTYPERSANPTAGPGILPCPAQITDPANPRNPANGQALGNCSFAGATTTGRLPWSTLDSGYLLDRANEVPWYIVTDNYRTPSPLGMVNSDTPGQLNVDGKGDIVAVIVAPGEPLSVPAQNRSAGAVNDISQYLEGENANGDTVFSQAAVGNDRLVYITRKELMQAVEKRVSGDVIQALRRYQADTGVFPWLTPFDPAPATTDYDAVVNTREGSLAYNDINEVFPSQFYVGWDFRSGGNGAPYTLTPTATMSNWNSFGTPTSPTTTPIKADMASVFYNLDGNNGPACRWISRDAINCVGRAKDPAPVTLRVTLWGLPLISVSGTRYYDFNVVIPADGTATVCSYAPCVNSERTRDVDLAADPIKYPASGFPPGTQARVTVTDAGAINACLNWGGTCWPLLAPIVITAAGQVPSSACVNFGYFGIYCTTLVVVNGGSKTNTITTATDANIDVYGSVFDLGVGDELPQWLTANNWHKLMYTAYSTADVPGAAVTPCVPGGAPACLTLQNTGPIANNKQAVVIMAGPALAGQNRVGPYPLTDYFENENNNGSDVFERNTLTATFNDLARAVAP